jgi:dihydrofolate reductase
MRTLTVFNHVTLDGFFVDANGDMRWAHRDSGDKEWSAFVAENAGGGGVLVFGRVTYQMMEGYWPTPAAKKNDPAVAERMNGMPKVVFSRTLEQVSWSNTTLVKTDLPGAIRKLKAESGPDLVILGSGTIVAQLASAGLIDRYQLVLNPLAIGSGRTLFDGIKNKVTLKLTKSRTFKNGNVVLSYEPTA